MYLGDSITARGLGNGVSVIIAFNVIGSFLRNVVTLQPWQIWAGLHDPFIWGAALTALALLTAAVRAMDAVCKIPITFFRTESPRSGKTVQQGAGLFLTAGFFHLFYVIFVGEVVFSLDVPSSSSLKERFEQYMCAII